MNVENTLSVKAGAQWELEFFKCTAEQLPMPEYGPLHASIDEAVKMQSELGWNPRCPSTETAQRLFRWVKHYLRPGDAEDLELYCTLGTPLDWFHGADGFFRIRTHVVFLDLTARRDKVQRKSVIFMESDKKGKGIERVAWHIARMLSKSIERKEPLASPAHT